LSRTRKWAQVAQEAGRLSSIGLTQKEIAARLGVNRVTVIRWMQAGKLARSGVRKRRKKSAPQRSVAQLQPGQTPAQWSAAVRSEYRLDATDDQLVRMAEAALEMSMDISAEYRVRTNAMGRFQALVKQLALVARNAAEPEKPAEEPQRPRMRVVQRPANAVDPRIALMTAMATK
jgi:transcriptional regulator with XRE-family HTH domain